MGWLCIGRGIAIGKFLPGFTGALRGLEFGKGRQINVPIAVLNWIIKLFSMALLAWAFFRIIFAAIISPAEAASMRCETDDTFRTI